MTLDASEISAECGWQNLAPNSRFEVSGKLNQELKSVMASPNSDTLQKHNNDFQDSSQIELKMAETSGQGFSTSSSIQAYSVFTEHKNFRDFSNDDRYL